MKMNGPTSTIREVRAKFSEYAALGYSGAGIVVDKHPTVMDSRDRRAGRLRRRKAPGTEKPSLPDGQLVARVPTSVHF